MKIAVIILAVLGAPAAGFLGMKWMGDLAELGNISELERVAAQAMTAAQGQSLGKMQAGAFILVLGAFAGFAGVFFALRNKFSLAGAGAHCRRHVLDTKGNH